jgi:TPR repeat protein
MCYNGQGCPKDEQLALMFFERASKLGHGFARRNAALLRLRSQSGIIDIVRGALSWISSIFYIMSLALKNARSHNLK